jgi:hypothetical protein
VGVRIVRFDVHCKGEELPREPITLLFLIRAALIAVLGGQSHDAPSEVVHLDGSTMAILVPTIQFNGAVKCNSRSAEVTEFGVAHPELPMELSKSWIRINCLPK